MIAQFDLVSRTKLKAMNFRHIILGSVLLFALAMTSACGSQEKSTDQTDTTEQSLESEKQGKEYTSAYVCPMHCEGSGSDEAGKCPVCGMDYVANEDAKSHDGHDHGEHDGHNH